MNAQRFRTSALVLTAAALAVPAVAAGDRPVFSVVTGTGDQQLWVETAADGAVSYQLLRRTPARIELAATGTDPAGKAVFVTWIEDGDERWAAYSRDGGRTWSDAREEPTELRLHARAVPSGVAAPTVDPSLQLPSDRRLHIVQFKTISLPEWRAALAEIGVESLRFFPDNGHIVRMDPSLIPRVESLEFVERVEPFHPAYRLEPELRDWLQGAGPSEELRANAVTFDRGAGAKSRVVAAAEEIGARVAQWFPSGRRLELWVTRDQLRSLAAHDEVAWIDRWSAPESDMDLVREDSGVNHVESLDGYCGQGVRGEVMDAGIQTDHMDFDGLLLHGGTGNDSHGTSTYGIVFGNGDRDGDGDAQATGHMPCAEQGIFASYPMMTDRYAHTEELKAAPYFASFQSNSWGSGLSLLYNSVSEEMDGIIFDLDIAITQSQSNNGDQFSRPQAWAKNIISVGGIAHQNTLDPSDDSWSGDASIGPARDGRIKPDVNYWNDSIRTTASSADPGGGYTSFFSGTSSATPEVAGVLGILVQMWSENVWGTDPAGGSVFERQPHFGTIKALLINNAWQYPFDGTDHDLTRVHQGWGRPNARIAAERASNSFVVDQDHPLTLGQTAGYDLNVRSDETELKVTMVYPDPPGTISSTLHRINDVDLRVTSPSGTIYHGNVGLDRGNYSIPGGGPNELDTVENVFVAFPEGGTWTVEVEAVEVNADGNPLTPGDDVVFALVVTGAGLDGQCGNGVRDAGEDCDGGDLGPGSCTTLGCDGGGGLSCNADCTYDATLCTGCPSCGDLACDPGENCLSCPGDCIFQSSQACGNGLCETADGEDCTTCSTDCRNDLSGNPSSRFCCGGGEYGVDCSDERCNDQFVTCVEIPSLEYCCGDQFCSVSEDDVSCAQDCAALTPGEAGSPGSGMLRADYDPVTGGLSLTFEAACGAVEHTIEYGDLTAQSLATYEWAGQQCALGAGGSYTWMPPSEPDSMFFVVVGNNGFVEGSYGVDHVGQERPEDTGASCPLAQELSGRCD